MISRASIDGIHKAWSSGTYHVAITDEVFPLGKIPINYTISGQGKLAYFVADI